MPVIDCLSVAEKKRLECDLTERACLHIIQIGKNPVNELYLKSKIAEAEKWNVEVVVDRFDEDMYYYAQTRVMHYNSDKKCDGIIVQLPTGLDKRKEQEICDLIHTNKDVDGLNTGSEFQPCTPQGIMWLLEDIGYEGKTIGIIGRGKLVGKPLIDMLRDKPCTLICMNSSTSKQQMSELLFDVDIVITCAGKPKLFNTDWLSIGTYVIDAGISRVDGKQVGDFNPIYESFADVNEIHYTKWVGNSVGKLTVAALMHNVRNAHERNKK